MKHIYKATHAKEVRRLQCVGHAQRRLGTALPKIKEGCERPQGQRQANKGPL